MRARIFKDDKDYTGFVGLLAETAERVPVRILAYCIMSNHWHLLLYPRHQGDLSAFLQRLTTTHVRRWHLRRRSVGSGHLYQGAYKSFPVQDDDHFLTVCRYVERNALRAGLVKRAEDWQWSSLWLRLNGGARDGPALSAWPVARPRHWLSWVNQPQTPQELEALRLSVQRGRPYGSGGWQKRIAKRLDLESTFRARGRPRKGA